MSGSQRLTNYGERVLLRRATRQDLAPMQLHLVTGTVAISDAAVLGDFDSPAFTEYSPALLSDDQWDDPITNGDSKGDVSYQELLYSFDGASAETITGAVWTLENETDIVLIEAWETPIDIAGNGDLAYTPRLLGFDPADLTQADTTPTELGF